METLLLNDSKKIDGVKLFFEKNEIEINLKNSLHVEDISLKTTGILILSEFQPSYLKPFIDYSIKNNIKILAVGRALISLISTLNNSKNKLDRSFSGDGSTFISFTLLSSRRCRFQLVSQGLCFLLPFYQFPFWIIFY